MPDDPRGTLPLDEIDPSGASILGTALRAPVEGLLAVHRGAQALGGDISDIARAIYEAGPGTLERVWQGELPPGAPETEEAARQTALTYGVPGGVPEEALGAGTRVPRGLRAPAGETPPKPARKQYIPKAPQVTPRREAAPLPQFAERYPEAGLSETKVDPKRQREYQGKAYTPEEQQLIKARSAAMRQMEKGYEPYYPPERRFFINPADYPEVAFDTAKADPEHRLIPANQATIDRHLAYIGAPETRARLQQAYRIGRTIPGAEHWYAMGQLERDFRRILGPEEGRKAFRDNFAGAMAATTRGQMPTPNMLMAHYLGYAKRRGLPQPKASFDLPHPVGGQYAMSNVEEYNRIYGSGGPGFFQGAINPKPTDFQQSILGYRPPFTWDIQMTRGTTGQNLPDWYGLMERMGREEAAKSPDWPSEFQGKAWAGFQRQADPKKMADPNYRAQPFIAHVNDAIERTHRITGMPKDEIVERGLVRQEIPLYGLAALGMLGIGAAELPTAKEQNE